MESANQPQEEVKTVWQSHGHRRHWLLKTILALIILLLVFMAGYALGVIKSRFSYYFQGFIDRPAGSHMYPNSGNGYYGHLNNSEPYDNQVEQNLMGTITKLDGPNITISDNGGVTHTVVSSSKTIVYNPAAKGGSESGLNQLKVGQFINVFGQENASGQFEATEIDISD